MTKEDGIKPEIRDRLQQNVDANSDLTEAAALELATVEIKVVRQARLAALRDRPTGLSALPPPLPAGPARRAR